MTRLRGFSPPAMDDEPLPARPVSRTGSSRATGTAVVPAAAGSAPPLTARLEQLDSEILMLILKHAPTADVARVCRVCKAFWRVAGDEQLWHMRARFDLNASARTPWCATWRETYRDALSVRIGDGVEVRDMYGLWVTGRVMARLDPLRMLVNFEGWSDKWLVWIDRAEDRERIRPLGSADGDCPGLGSAGALTAESFAEKCGAVHARLAIGSSQWPPPSREHSRALPAMYRAEGVAGRPGSARPGSAKRGPLAWHSSQVDGSVMLRIANPANWQRQQTLLSCKEFRSAREIAAAYYAAAHPPEPEPEPEPVALTGEALRAAEWKAAAEEQEEPEPEPAADDGPAELSVPVDEPLERYGEARTLDAVLLQAAPAVHTARGAEAASRNPFKVGQVVELTLDGMERAALPTLRGGSAMQQAKLTGRVMVRLNAELFLAQCEGWRHDGLVWLVRPSSRDHPLLLCSFR